MQAAEVPKVVVNILVDQLRSDYLEAFMPLYGDDGLKTLLKDGRVYAQGEYPLTHTDRASASATFSTGTVPARHGIVGVQWVDRETSKPVNCVSDLTANKLLTSTVGDELKIATEGKAIVISLAPNSDAAIMLAGHAADAAIWLDDYSGKWVTSNYYGGVPAWVNVRNTAITALKNAPTWTPSNDLVGNFSYFLSGGMKKPFHHIFDGTKGHQQWKTSALVNDEVANATEQAVKGTLIGNDNLTDYLGVMLYAGGFDGHTANEMPLELQDTYVRLDRAVAKILKALENKVKREEMMVVLTSTGYVEENQSDLSKYRIPTGDFDMQRATSLLAMYLRAVYGVGDLVQTSYGTQIYLNNKLIEQRQINQTELFDRCQDFLLQLQGVKDVYTRQRLIQGAWTPGLSRIRNAYNVQVSGDITIEVAPGWRAVNATSKTSKVSRESYVSFPVIFYGHNIKSEQVATPVTVDYIAPTICGALRIRAPNGCETGRLF